MSENDSGKTNTVLYVGLGCAVLFLLLPVFGILIAVAIPGYLTYQHNTKHYEARLNLQAIRTAQLAYYAQHGSYISASAYPPSPSMDPQYWSVEESGGFQTLDWKPPADVRGSYLIRLGEDDFEILGIMDVDGDNMQATYVATKDKAPYQRTGSGIY